ncbi:MAG: M24 family metallopeptidase, partial [Alphaproteobacteria bacterium]|nr:M24 family metallopeptidase [Alphaproteobacteria bacterium]
MDKIKLLRDFIKKEGLSALLIPRTDEFQGEYIAPYSERLAWLTGFNGSAGFAIITLKKAAFFTDGRYTLQAKVEVPDIYEIYNTSQKTPAQWALENLSFDDMIGYDPWLFTEKQLEFYKNSLIPLNKNPIDSLWIDRPLPPQDFIRLHPLEFSGESDESKRKRIAKTLKADHLLLTSCDSIAWLLNIRGNDVPHTPLVHSVCLVHKDGSYDLFLDLNKITGMVYNHIQKGSGRAIEIRFLLKHLKTLKGTCQVDPLTTPVLFIQTLKSQVVREQDPCILPKALKNPIEIEGVKKAHVQDSIALQRFFTWLEEQPLQGETTELSAANKLYEFRKNGKHFEDLSFNTISAFGPHGAIIHYKATPGTDSPLSRTNLYLLDSGGQYLAGTTDITRTLCLGSPTPEQKEMYTRVLKGHIALAEAIFPEGTTGAQLDVLARQYLWEVGLDYDHGTGHGVGSYLSVHEGPQGISKRGANVPLEPGMILSNEPGYYKEGEYGIRIESLIYVIKLIKPKGFLGFEALTLVPLEQKLMDETLLTEKEKKW